MLTTRMSVLNPKASIAAMSSWSRSPVVKNTTFSVSWFAPANCFAKSSRAVPGSPVTRIVKPRGTPFIMALSRAGIPVDVTFATSVPLHRDRLVAHEVHRVPHLVRLVLLHGEDERVGVLAPQAVDEDVEELVEDLHVVVDGGRVDRVQDEDILAVSG